MLLQKCVKMDKSVYRKGRLQIIQTVESRFASTIDGVQSATITLEWKRLESCVDNLDFLQKVRGICFIYTETLSQSRSIRLCLIVDMTESILYCTHTTLSLYRSNPHRKGSLQTRKWDHLPRQYGMSGK